MPISSIVSAMTAAPCFFDERHDGVDALPAVLHVDGVDDRAAGDVLERCLDDVGFGGVDHERRLDASSRAA